MSENGVHNMPFWHNKYQTMTDWGSLSHAYGAAADLPGLFDRVCSGDVPDAGRAVSEIALRICHQGIAVEEATAPSVEVLMGIAKTSSHQLAERIFLVLQSISESIGTWSKVARGCSVERQHFYIPNMQWEHATLQSLKSGVNQFSVEITYRDSSFLISNFDSLVEAISEADDRIC